MNWHGFWCEGPGSPLVREVLLTSISTVMKSRQEVRSRRTTRYIKYMYLASLLLSTATAILIV